MVAGAGHPVRYGAGSMACPDSLYQSDLVGSTPEILLGGLNIDQTTLIACQGETTSDMNEAVNGESDSELGQR